MTIDDIYLAARDGNIPLLRQLVSEEPQLLNEPFSTTLDDGAEFTMTCVFSILSLMRTGRLNYEVLDCIVNAGADLNASMKREVNGDCNYEPLLQYAVGVWHHYEMAKYMLQHGANPNILHIENSLSMPSETTMLWHAIMQNDTPDMLELLLQNGADPDRCCKVFVNDISAYQWLHPLYYSVVEARSVPMTTVLLNYGASPTYEMDLGRGMMRHTSVYDYVRLQHKNLKPILDNAMDQAKRTPPPATRQSTARRQPTGSGQATPSAQTAIRNALNGSNERRDRSGGQGDWRNRSYDPRRKLYSKFTAYLFANFLVIGAGFTIAALFQKDAGLIVGFLIFGLGGLGISTLIAMNVNAKAKKRGRTNVMIEFVYDSFRVFGLVLLGMTIILLPLVIAIAKNDRWVTKETTDGRSVYVKDKGHGNYEDATGGQYVDKHHSDYD